MKPTTLASTALLALSLSTAAHAVHLDPGGRGQVLVYPYYTVNSGQQTLLSVTNTASVAQAVKVRFREGYNGRDVLNFNLFLSPFDAWTGTIFALRDAGIDSDGAAVISTDTSCTAPLFSEDATSLNGTPYVAFRDFLFTQFGALDDGGPYGLGRTREGYIEIYAMADVAAPLSATIAHGSNGSAPTGCAQVRNLLPDNGALSTPTGGLMGSVSIINVAKGTYLSVRAEALGGFTGVPLFTETGSLLPNLADVNDGAGPLRAKATAHILDANNRRQSLTYPGPDSRSRRVDAVSAAFMADRVYNEFQIASSLAAASDWLLMFPTKLFYVDELYTSSLSTSALPPFPRIYRGSYGGVDRYSQTFFKNIAYSQDGRSGATLCPTLGSSGCERALFLGFVTNVFPVQPLSYPSFGPAPPSLVLGSPLVWLRPYPLQYPAPSQRAISDSGHMMFDLDPRAENTGREPHALLPSAEGKVLRGLPVVGFWSSNVVNNNVGNGVLSNYAAAVRHATSVTCVKASDGTPCD